MTRAEKKASLTPLTNKELEKTAGDFRMDGYVKGTFAKRLESALALAEGALTRLSHAKPDQLDHSADVAIIERAARISADALLAIAKIKAGNHAR